MHTTQILIRLTGCALLAGLAGCSGPSGSPKPVSPVTMNAPVKEGALNILTLTPAAVKRLGIATITAGEGSTSDAGVYSGELMAVPGQTVTLTAPLAGTLLGATGGNGLLAGQAVQKGQGIYRLLILPSEKDLISAKEDVAQKEVQFTVTTQKTERAKKLLEEKAGSLRAVQEAEAELAGVNASLNVARARLELLKGNASDKVSANLSTLDIKAPVSGFVQRVYTSTSQVVAAGAPIAEIAATNALWVRIPVYAGDLNRISRQAPAAVQLLSDFGGSAATYPATSVQGPQTADPLNTSVDLYYQLANADRRFRPGERVSVNIPYTGKSSGMMIPVSAIVYDIHGNTWVYQRTDSTAFTRIRVEVQRVEQQNAMIARGIKGGENIVITGAAELFGAEFGGGK